MVRWMLRSATAVIIMLAGCGGSDDTGEVESVPPAATTDAPAETAAEADASTTAALTTEEPTTTEVAPTTAAATTTEAPTTTTEPATAVNDKKAMANAVAVGVPAEANCRWPDEMRHAEKVRCRITNPDGSKGRWDIVLNLDMSVIQPKYTETKAAPLTREQCTATPEQGLFQKDSTAFQGQCMHFWVEIFQFDANTGPCAFLGHYGSAPHGSWVDFSDAIVTVQADADHCRLLGPVVEDDLVEVWAVNTGIESYDTTAGGSNTYTVFELVDIVVYGHDD